MRDLKRRRSAHAWKLQASDGVKKHYRFSRIDPRFVDVAARRWEDPTGNTLNVVRVCVVVRHSLVTTAGTSMSAP
jgi:hypothetical protein